MTTLSGIGKYVIGSAMLHFELLPRHLHRANEKYQEAFPTHMYNNWCSGQLQKHTSLIHVTSFTALFTLFDFWSH
jgi:hypothetical protein